MISRDLTCGDLHEAALHFLTPLLPRPSVAIARPRLAT
jgi:hypothetical protein